MIKLIILHEYLNRIKKKSFLIGTILGPIGILTMIFLPIYLSMSDDVIEEKKILVLDESKMFLNEFGQADNYLNFETIDINLEDAKKNILNESCYGLLYIPKIDIENPTGFEFYSLANPSITIIENIQHKINNKLEEHKLKKLNLDPNFIESFKVYAKLKTISFSESGEEQENSSFIATGIGYILAIMIYIFIFIYGSFCMRGVLEEKNSKIVEIIISTVKPFHLMMGKILGIAFVGLTQFLIWIILSFVGIMIFMNVFNSNEIMESATNSKVIENQNIDSKEIEESISNNFFELLNSINLPLVIIGFLFYFFGGYLMYGSLFAAIGSASNSETDAQQFIFPITLPLILSIIMINVVLQDTNGNLAFWLSIIPFTSPVIMLMRLPFGLPMWHLILSMILLILGFIFTTWLASRIYRIGILTHGSKINWKILIKWFFIK